MNTPEKMFKSTVLVNVYEHLEDKEYTFGTGFFFKFNNINGKNVIAIVTNKHVVEKGVHYTFFFRPMNASGIKQIIVRDAKDGWIYHDTYDLAVMPIAYLLNHKDIGQESTGLSASCLEEALIPNAEDVKNLLHIEEIIMMGYPDHVIDVVNNLPIARRGITAIPYKYNFNGESLFLADIASYGGSSGSPVFLYNHQPYMEESNFCINKERFFLLGIMTEVYEHKIRIADDIIKIPNGVGCAIKSERLLDFKPKLQECTYDLCPPGIIC